MIRGFRLTPSRFLPWYRLIVLVAVSLLVRKNHSQFLIARSSLNDVPPSLQQVQSLYPTARRLTPRGRLNVSSEQPLGVVSQGWNVLDEDAVELGYVLRTSPECDDIVGFSGPSNLLIGIDATDRIVGVRLIDSKDTAEHIEAVRRDPQFLNSWNNVARNEAAEQSYRVQAVSGATLTSLAVVDAVTRRLGGTNASQRFPQAVDVSELLSTFPAAHRLAPDPQRNGWLKILDAQGQLLGRAVRTSPTEDKIHGYQGPTDSLIVLDLQDRVQAARVRTSFDNQPYVSYLNDDAYFFKTFVGNSWHELSELNAFGPPIEGVSGATMTSLAVADSIVSLASRSIEPPRVPRDVRRLSWLTLHNLGTLAVVAAGVAMTFSRLRRLRHARFYFQVLLIGYLGFLNGDMISQALLVGWSQNGVPWRIAGPLVLMVGAAFLVPFASRRPLYCHQLCPHGAAQELLLRLRVPRKAVPRKWHNVARALPALMLGGVLVTALGHLPLSLASIEPFHAYLFRIAGWSTILIAVLGLAVSACVPMAYCKYGCPTGALLQYVRRHAGPDRWRLADSWSAILLLLAGSFVVWPSLRLPMSIHTPVAATLRQANRDAPTVMTCGGKTMGTSWSIAFLPKGGPDEANSVQREVAGLLADLDARLSHWKYDSEVSRFNRLRETMPVEISDDLAQIVRVSLTVWHASGGAFDITSGPLVRMWGFGPIHADGSASRESITNAISQMGSQHLSLRRAANGRWTLRKAIPTIELDLSAVAKGYAVDRVTQLLQGRGYADVLVEVGGEVRATGRSPLGWLVGIESPIAVERHPTELCLSSVVPLVDRAIATSGSYRQFRFTEPGVAGQRPNGVTHIVDPRNGSARATSVVGASVIARTAAEADAWATALMVLGVEEGSVRARHYGLEARFVSGCR
ncbi:MAG: FAD:protein FMN transferase [Pirellulaceae bacterium]|nr:FAD:protein FMN transferase [Planctomycetales bacterium]